MTLTDVDGDGKPELVRVVDGVLMAAALLPANGTDTLGAGRLTAVDNGFGAHTEIRDWESADQLRVAIDAWLQHYLHHRPHQALNWQTPSERRAERLAAPVALAA